MIELCQNYQSLRFPNQNFPLRLSYSVTINGQVFDKLGIYLTSLYFHMVNYMGPFQESQH